MVIQSAAPQKPPAIPHPNDLRWALRDWLAAASLFVATAAVTLWQSTHVAALFDLSYILNTAERIALGQVPYRDFPLPHAPLTFLVQAAIIRLTGRVIFHHDLYAAIVSGLGAVVAWRTSLALLRDRIAAAWIVALLLAAPLAFLGVYCIVPNPEYDCDCGFWLVVAVWAFTQLDRKKSLSFAFTAGALACVPVFYKQNMGLPFLFTAVVAVLCVLFLLRGQSSLLAAETRSLLAYLAGVCAALLAALLVIQSTAGLANYIHWTIQYAGQRRMPGFTPMLGVYSDPTLLWTVPSVAAALILLRWSQLSHHRRASLHPALAETQPLWIQIVAFLLLAAPFLFTLASLQLYADAEDRGDALLVLWPLALLLAAALALVNLYGLRRKPSLRAFTPLLLLAAIHGAFMSQQLWGSTYGIWPLLTLLLADLLACLGMLAARAGVARSFAPLVAASISLVLLVCGCSYTFSEERLSYANLPDVPPAHSAFPALAGLATPGPYIPEIDELLRYARLQIPFNDGILLIPGEEPFYFATGRAPQFPVPFFDPTIDPYPPSRIAALVRTRNIHWLIVKTDVQTIGDPTPDRDALMQLLLQEFQPAARLRGYAVYRR